MRVCVWGVSDGLVAGERDRRGSLRGGSACVCGGGGVSDGLVAGEHDERGSLWRRNAW